MRVLDQRVKQCHVGSKKTCRHDRVLAGLAVDVFAVLVLKRPVFLEDEIAGIVQERSEDCRSYIPYPQKLGKSVEHYVVQGDAKSPSNKEADDARDAVRLSHLHSSYMESLILLQK